MDWGEAIVYYVVPPAVLALLGIVMRLWKTSNPARQERHFRQVGKHENVLTEHAGRLGSCEQAIADNKGHGEQLARLETEVGHLQTEVKHVRDDTGEILKLVLKGKE